MPKLLPHIGVPANQRRVLSTLATMALMLVVMDIYVLPARISSLLERQKAALEEQQHNTALLPSVLSKEDMAHYRDAFALERSGHTQAADAALSQVQSPLLKGVLLGERYLGQDDSPNFSEIALWLSRYGDHPQAAALYQLARAKVPGDADFLTEPALTATLKGFSNGTDKSGLPEERHWVSGLAAFRRHDMTTAAAHFKALLKADDDYLSYDDHAAAAFWAYRATAAAGDTQGALKYIEEAAEEPPSFYSILARQVLGERAVKSGDAEDADISSFMEKNGVRRAIALKSIGQDALAEKEIRALFPASNAGDRRHLVELARLLNLPAAQMRMAVTGAYDASAQDARFPLPHWTPTSGYSVAPALLFAIMRQESGFNPNARSASGAMGVMQLMPATAHAMALSTRLALSQEPSVSMALGQRYLERLMEVPAVGDNLVYILASYNAGPGNVISWQKSIHAENDPLLFIESIPNTQTRDYVVHVTGNYWVYSELLGGYDTASVTALAANRWPHYEHQTKQELSMASHMADAGTE